MVLIQLIADENDVVVVVVPFKVRPMEWFHTFSYAKIWAENGPINMLFSYLIYAYNTEMMIADKNV